MNSEGLIAERVRREKALVRSGGKPARELVRPARRAGRDAKLAAPPSIPQVDFRSIGSSVLMVIVLMVLVFVLVLVFVFVLVFILVMITVVIFAAVVVMVAAATTSRGAARHSIDLVGIQCHCSA